MIATVAIAWLGAAVLVALVVTARARARRRQADRWAALVGIQRMPGESSEELVQRAAARMRITR